MKRVSKACSVLGFLVVILAGGVAGAEADTPGTPNPYVAPPDQALVIFSRARRRQASDVTLRIVNPAGRCLAELENGWQMAAPLWPGTHMLMVVTGEAPPTVQLMEVKVRAGYTYVVRLETRVNIKRPVRISMVRRTNQPLQVFPTEIREAIPVAPSLRRCTEWVFWKRSKIEPRAERAKHEWDEADEAQRNLRTLYRNDGWTASELAAP